MRLREAAIPPREEITSLAAAIALWDASPHGNVRLLYAAFVKLLTDGTVH
jgi:hypothetical protein